MIVNSLLVGMGGFLGAISRYVISKWLNKPIPAIPYGTLTVNLVGAFLLGWIAGSRLSEKWILLLGTGFMGSFTTFSTLNWESVQLGEEREWRKFMLYLGLSYIVGMLMVLFGYLIGDAVSHHQ